MIIPRIEVPEWDRRNGDRNFLDDILDFVASGEFEWRDRTELCTARCLDFAQYHVHVDGEIRPALSYYTCSMLLVRTWSERRPSNG